MPTQALYRQWRPACFEDVSGQDAVITTLKNQVASGRVSHAYLFCGSRGTGKTTSAKIFARAVNCAQPIDGEPCGVCDACKALEEENNLDIVEIDAASNNGVDEIRDLREKVKYPPQHGRYRVYIIDEVHMLSTGAFNALLKTLEEPPPHAMFILATTEPQRLPATVLSRVQRYDFRRIPVQTIVARLSEIAAGEHVDVSAGALQRIASSAEGGMRDAISLLDMAIAYGGGSVDEALVREVLGATDRGFLFGFADHLIDGDAAGVMQDIDTLMRAGREAQVFARDVTAHLRALLMAQTVAGTLADLLEITEEDAEAYRKQAARIGRERLLAMLDLFLAADTDMRWAGSPRTALEVAAARACLPEEALRLDAMASRLDLLEQRMAQGVPAASSAAVLPTTEPMPIPEQAKPVNPMAEAPAKPAPTTPGAASPADGGDIWDKARVMLRAEPQLNAPIMQGKFLGIDGDVAHLEYGKTGKIFMDMLAQDARRARVEEILAEAAGRPITLHLSLESTEKKAAPGAKDRQQQVFDLFGRANVEVVDEIENP